MLPVVFFAGRLLLYLALMPNDIRGLGDYYNYFSVSNLPGIPFLDFWTEYPPIFSFFLEFLNIISNSNQYLFFPLSLCHILWINQYLVVFKNCS